MICINLNVSVVCRKPICELLIPETGLRREEERGNLDLKVMRDEGGEESGCRKMSTQKEGKDELEGDEGQNM